MIYVAQHSIILENREKMTVSAVDEVESFSDDIIVLKVGDSLLKIKGENLNIGHFSAESGDFLMTGKVLGMVYSDNQKVNIKGRLFK